MLFGLKVGLSAAECAQCKTLNEVGASECFGCGANLAAAGAGRSLQHKRLETHRQTRERFETLLSTQRANLQPAVTVTDARQYVRFLNNPGIAFADHLSKPASLLADIDLSTMQATHAKEAYTSLSTICGAAEEAYDVYRTLYSVLPPADFAEFHTLLTTFMSAVLDMYIYGMRALFAMTRVDAFEQQRRLQHAVDMAREAAAQLGDTFARIDVEILDPGDTNQRLAVLTGQSAQYDHNSEIDLGAVLSAALSSHDDLSGVARAVLPHLRDLFGTDAVEVAEEQALGLLATAAALSMTDNLVTIKRRARIFLDLLREAHNFHPTDFEGATRKAARDVLTSETIALTIGEQLRVYASAQMSREARRMVLKDAYSNLAENIWRRLSSFLLYAMFLLESMPMTYEDIADWAGFGEKVQWLLDQHKPQYALALEGVSAVMRNAGSHGGVDVMGDKIVLTNVNPQTRKVRTEELTDEEFEVRIRQMLDTCLALRTAFDIFVLGHWATFRDELISLRPPSRLAVEIVKYLLGNWDLSVAYVAVGDRILHVKASLLKPHQPRPYSQYVSICAIFAALMPDVTDVDFLVTRGESVDCHIASSLVPFRAFSSANETVRDIMVLPTMAQLSITTPDQQMADGATRYRGVVAFNVAHFLMVDVARLGEDRGKAVLNRNGYRELVDSVGQRLRAYRQVLLQTPASVCVNALRNGLLEALRDLEQGLRKERRALQNSESFVPTAANIELARAGQVALQIREKTLADAKAMNSNSRP